MSAEDNPTTGHQRRHMIVRRHHEAAILKSLLAEGALTRARIADSVGVSKPTTNAIVEDLKARGIICESSSGASPTYVIGPGAGLVAAVSVGATHLRAAVCDAYGSILHSIGPVPTEVATKDLLDAVSGLILQCAAQTDPSELRHVTLSVPGVPHEIDPAITLAPHVPALTEPGFLAALSERLNISVAAENDANMAALGERWQGAARGRDDFVTIHIGTGLGLGIISGGRLLRGARGAAGEIGYLPGDGDSSRGRPALESQLGRQGIRRLLRSYNLEFDHVPLDEVIIALESASNQSVQGAEQALEHIARTVAGALLSVQAIVDPSLIVLNGAIGSSESLARRVRGMLLDLSPLQSNVVTTTLGSMAPLLGALSLGRERLVQELTTPDLPATVKSS